jgi:hypothetical protein
MTHAKISGPLLCRFLFGAYRADAPEDPAAVLVYPMARPISAPDEQGPSLWFSWELESGKFARHQPPPPPESRKPKKERVKKVAARKKRRGW